MYSQSLTVTKQLPELEASLEVSFGHLKLELSETDETIKHRGYKAARIKICILFRVVQIILYE
jgi:hypothetical protein